MTIEIDQYSDEKFDNLKPSEVLGIYLAHEDAVIELFDRLVIPYDKDMLLTTKAAVGQTYRVYYGNYHEQNNRIKVGTIKPTHIRYDTDYSVSTRKRRNLHALYEKKQKIKLLINKI